MATTPIKSRGAQAPAPASGLLGPRVFTAWLPWRSRMERTTEAKNETPGDKTLVGTHSRASHLTSLSLSFPTCDVKTVTRVSW